MMGLDEHVGDFCTRLKLLDFTITHCPAEEIGSLLQSRQMLQIQVHTQLANICDVWGMTVWISCFGLRKHITCMLFCITAYIDFGNSPAINM